LPFLKHKVILQNTADMTVLSEQSWLYARKQGLFRNRLPGLQSSPSKPHSGWSWGNSTLSRVAKACNFYISNFQHQNTVKITFVQCLLFANVYVSLKMLAEIMLVVSRSCTHSVWFGHRNSRSPAPSACMVRPSIQTEKQRH